MKPLLQQKKDYDTLNLGFGFILIILIGKFA